MAPGISIEPTGWLLGSVAGQPVVAVHLYWPVSSVAEEWRARAPGWAPAPPLLDVASGIDWQPSTRAAVEAWITSQRALAR